MKNFMKKATQKIMLVMTCLIVFNFVAPIYPTYAADDETIGGYLLSPILGLLGALGDGFLGMIQYAMIGPSGDYTLAVFPSKKTALESTDDKKVFDNSGNPTEKYKFLEQKSGVKARQIPSNYFFEEKYGIPIMRYGPEEIFSGKVAGLDVNFIQGKNPNATLGADKSSVDNLRGVIAKWYVAIRNLALVGLLSVLVYIGIRILMGSASSEKAKYKQMLMDWLVALCLLFTLHFIMSFIMVIVDNVTLMVGSTDSAINITITENGTPKAKFKTSLIGLVRLQTKAVDTWEQIGYMAVYLTLVGFTAMFTFVYLKRLLYMAFLTLMAPLVSLTYPIDKISDGQAQAFNMWLKEYIFNALLQPFHLLLYTILVTSAIQLVSVNVVYAVAAIWFLLPAEKLLRSMFGFEKAQTSSGLGGFAGGALFSTLLNKIGSKGGSSKKTSSSSSGSSSDTSQVKQKRSADYGGFGSGEEGDSSQPNEEQESGNVRTSEQQNGNEDSPGSENSNQPRGEMPDTRAGDAAAARSELNGNNSNSNRAQGQDLPEGKDDFRRKIEERRANQARQNTAKNVANRKNATAKKKTATGKKRRIKGMWNVAKKYGVKGVKSGGKFLGKSLLRGAGAVALGGLGFLAGAATGDFSKAMQYAASGGTAGALVGNKVASGVGTAYDKVKNIKSSELVQTYRTGSLGEKEAALKRNAEAFKQNKENQQYFASEFAKDGKPLKGRELKAVMDRASKYTEYGINDVSDIKSAMKLEDSIVQEGYSKQAAFSQSVKATKEAAKYKETDLMDPKKLAQMQENYAGQIIEGAKENGETKTQAQAMKEAELVIRRVQQAKDVATVPPARQIETKDSKNSKPKIELADGGTWSVDRARNNKGDEKPHIII